MGIAFKMEESVNIQALVRDKVQTFSSNKIEELLVDFMKQEFRFIEKIGAVLGFLIGVIQVILITAF